MPETDTSTLLILALLVLISFLLIFIIYKIKSTDQDKIVKNFGELEGTVKTKLTDFFSEIKKENERSEESLGNMLDKMSSIERTLTGTKSKGIAGEALLGLYLESSIKTGEVKKDLKIGTKIVEFAWKVSEGKYIPIDAKFPEIKALVEEHDKSEDTVHKKSLSKKVKDKVKKEIENIQKDLKKMMAKILIICISSIQWNGN